MTTLPKPLRGIVPPVLTPLLDRDRLDTVAFSRLINHLIEGGVSALFILGSTGEAPGLSPALQRDAVDCAVEAARDRVPLLVGITNTCFAETVRLAAHSSRSGAAAVVSSAPYYFKLSQRMFLGYLERLTIELPLPLYLYNMPSYTKMFIQPETVRTAAAMPGIYGLKDSSGDREYFRRVHESVSDFPDFALLAGIEEILGETVISGEAHGGVCGGANLVPRLYVDLFEAASRRDRSRVSALQEQVMRISSTVYRIGEPESSYLRGLKCAVSLAGFGNGLMAEPYESFNEEQRAMLRAELVRIGILSNGVNVQDD